jgi:hypothetical protein
MMAKRGRPANVVPPLVVSVKLRLYPGQDDDLIAYLACSGPRLRATLVKLAMRQGALSRPAQAAEPATDEFDGFDGLWQ